MSTRKGNGGKEQKPEYRSGYEIAPKSRILRSNPWRSSTMAPPDESPKQTGTGSSVPASISDLSKMSNPSQKDLLPPFMVGGKPHDGREWKYLGPMVGDVGKMLDADHRLTDADKEAIVSRFGPELLFEKRDSRRALGDILRGVVERYLADKGTVKMELPNGRTVSAEELAKVRSGGPTYDDIATPKKPWVMVPDGGFEQYPKGALISSLSGSDAHEVEVLRSLIHECESQEASATFGWRNPVSGAFPLKGNDASMTPEEYERYMRKYWNAFPTDPKDIGLSPKQIISKYINRWKARQILDKDPSLDENDKAEITKAVDARSAEIGQDGKTIGDITGEEARKYLARKAQTTMETDNPAKVVR